MKDNWCDGWWIWVVFYVDLREYMLEMTESIQQRPERCSCFIYLARYSPEKRKRTYQFQRYQVLILALYRHQGWSTLVQYWESVTAQFTASVTLPPFARSWQIRVNGPSSRHVVAYAIQSNLNANVSFRFFASLVIPSDPMPLNCLTKFWIVMRLPMLTLNQVSKLSQRHTINKMVP